MAMLEDVLPTRRWTADEVWRMVEVGLLRDDERYELIDGELVQVSPQGEDHARVVAELHRRFVLAYPYPQFVIRGHSPVGGVRDWIPEPDLVVDAAPRSQATAPRPDQTVLVVEVAMTSHRLDRRKGGVYAACGAPEFWLVDLVRREVLIHRSPLASGDWGRVELACAGDRIALPMADAQICVDEILTLGPSA